MNRFQRYRELMRTLDASGDPRSGLQQGWWVERRASAVAESITRRIELEPESSHLIVGGMGSGKTTELWRLHERLRAPGIATATGHRSHYIDVAAQTHLDRLSPGALVALARKRLVPDGVRVLIFDALDRIRDIERLERVLAEDIIELRRSGIGVVVAGPMRLLYSRHPVTADIFGQNVHMLVDVAPNGPGMEILLEMLSRRVSPKIVPRDSCIAIARASGGVLRDLIALARAAAQEAYAAGSDVVHAAHVAQAVDRFGRLRAVGLDDEQVQTLQTVRDGGTLVIRGERELSLLETRRVLDYENGRFVVHPALAPLLDLITVAA